jgi:hypothetical protein
MLNCSEADGARDEMVKPGSILLTGVSAFVQPLNAFSLKRYHTKAHGFLGTVLRARLTFATLAAFVAQAV